MDTHILGELLPAIGDCDRRCDHSDALTGVHQWDGLTYCIHCCKHSFGHKNFVFDLGDGYDTCTLCFRVVGQHIKMLRNNKPSRSRRRVKPIIPKIVLTDCDGAAGCVNKG